MHSSDGSAVRRGRRVVAGHDSNGKAAFLSDAELEPFRPALSPGSEWDVVWQADEADVSPGGDEQTSKQFTFFPPNGGFRFYISTTPPAGSAPPLDGEALTQALAEFDHHLPGLVGTLGSDGMHTTDTVDVHLVLSGEVVFELDDGAQKSVRAGDVLVLQGTPHRFEVRGTTPAVVATFMTGATRAQPSH